jgi:hypothetical protein
MVENGNSLAPVNLLIRHSKDGAQKSLVEQALLTLSLKTHGTQQNYDLSIPSALPVTKPIMNACVFLHMHIGCLL